MDAQSMYARLAGGLPEAPPAFKVSPPTTRAPKEGVIVVFGGTNWDELTKGAASHKDAAPNLPGPHRLLAGLADVKVSFVATGCCSSHCVALSSAGAAFAWGKNDMGQLGLGDTTTRAGPTAVAALKSKKIASAATGKQHTLWLTHSGEVLAAGNSKLGCVGGGASKKKEMETSPIPVPGLPSVESVAAGGAFNLVIDRNGTLYSFGCAEFGVLGNGTDGCYNKKACARGGRESGAQKTARAAGQGPPPAVPLECPHARSDHTLGVPAPSK